MASKRARSVTKATQTSSTAINRSLLFGRPPLIEGEDPVAYGELLALVATALEPADIIEEIFVNDFIIQQWEVLRWRRLKTSLFKIPASAELNLFLERELDICVYRKTLEDQLADALLETLGQSALARDLARRCLANEPAAVEETQKILEASDRDLEIFLQDVREEEVQKLALAYVRRRPRAVRQVDQLLASRGLTLDDLLAEKLSDTTMSLFERIDRLIDVAERRRNAVLGEIERHRASSGRALRRAVQQIEEAEFQLVESPSVAGAPS